MLDISETSIIERKKIKSPLGDQIEIVTTKKLDGTFESEEVTIYYQGECRVS
jgi:hypothetical protein